MITVLPLLVSARQKYFNKSSIIFFSVLPLQEGSFSEAEAGTIFLFYLPPVIISYNLGVTNFKKQPINRLNIIVNKGAIT